MTDGIALIRTIESDGGALAGSLSEGGSGPVGHVGGAPTWDPLQCHVTPVPEPSDPTAAEQWSLIRKYCLALGKQDCLKNGSVFSVGGCTPDQAVDACVAQVLWSTNSSVTPECEDAWRTDIECGTNATLAPPACGNVGTIGPYGPTDTCAQENAALFDCTTKYSTRLQVTGSYATCDYSRASVSASECTVGCQVGQYWAGLYCAGSDGLPKQCSCSINGHIVTDPNAVFVSDCADAAQQAADGLCTGKLDCCFEYQDGSKSACLCEQPTEFGYDSCEAMVAFAKGRRVEICPTLLPDSGGGCWPPGGCSP